MARDQEHADQCALVAWARHAAESGVVEGPGRARVRLGERQRLALAHLYAVPNGARTGRRQAGRLKAEGLLSGVPDLVLPYPTSAAAGLYLEMKTPTGTLSAAQKTVTAALASLGYAVAVARGYDAARRAVLDHLLS